MNDEELSRKVRNLEALAADQVVMSPAQRAALRDEVEQLLASLDMGKSLKRWAIGGAAAGAVLPVVGVISGGVAGAVYGAYRASRRETSDARERLKRLAAELV